MSESLNELAERVEGAKGRRRCSFCPRRATAIVSDESDFFDCCSRCEAAWQRDPGFMADAKQENLQ